MRRENKVYSGGTSLTGNTGNKIFQFTFFIGIGRNHKIGKLVHYQNNVRKFVYYVIFDVFEIVVFADIADSMRLQFFISTLHFFSRPFKCVECLGGFGYSVRNHHVRQTAVCRKFNSFGVNENEFYVFRRSFVQKTYDKRIKTCALTATGSTGN